MANKDKSEEIQFYRPKKWRYGIKSSDGGFVNTGFWLRRLIRDHKTPAVRLPRELVRSMGWRQGELLYVMPVRDIVVVGRLHYEDPTEVNYDYIDEARRKYSGDRSSDDPESGERSDGDAGSGGDRSGPARDGESLGGVSED